MSARIAAGRRLAGAVGLLLGLVLLTFVGAGGAQVAPGTPGFGIARPDISPTASNIRLLGAAARGAGGEAWALGELRPGQRVYAGEQPVAVGSSRAILLRHTDATGWEAQPPPVDAAGQPIDAVTPVVARVSPGGDVALLLGGPDPGVYVGNATTPVKALPAPPSGAAGLDTGETLTEGTRGAMAIADGPTVYVGALTETSRERAVLRYSGGAWTRETVDLPGSGSFKIVALAAAEDGAAWLLARAQGRGIALYQRESDGVWRERSLAGSNFETRDPGDGISQIQPIDAPAESLTATADGVWADGRLIGPDGTRTFTLFYDADARSVSSSYCDVTTASATAFCSRPLGSELARNDAYRSYAWPGAGDGSRVITDPVTTSGDRATTRGSYLVLRNGSAQRVAGAGAAPTDPAGGAFLAPDRGWLGGGGTAGADGGAAASGTGAGVTEVRPSATPPRLENWPVALRRPLTAVTSAPGQTVGAVETGALAVGADGAIARYTPGSGWRPEPLLDSAGIRATPRLRGVAWPVAARAYAVGDRGQMWLWRQETGLWERDEGAPLDFEGNLMGVAFQPGNPDRGYAVGRRGLILRFDKSWTPESAPSGLGDRDLTSIAFAGTQAIAAAGGDVLLNDGGGWRVDEQARALLAEAEGTAITVAGLRDGGAVVAGRGIALVRQNATAPWRPTRQPLGAFTAVTAAAIRDASGTVRAVLSVTAQPDYPAPVDDNVIIDPEAPPPIFDVLPLPRAGHLLRETESGWQDEQHGAFRPTGEDLPVRPDAILGFALDERGEGWVVGGETGEAFDSGGERTQTASISRYPPSGIAPPGAGSAVEPLPADRVRLAVGGHAACRQSCWDLGAQQLGPDVTLVAARQRADELATQPGGPRAFLFTGARIDGGAATLSGPDATRLAQLSAGSLGFFATPGPSEGGAGAAAFRGGLANAATPFGFGPLPQGISVSDIPGASGDAGARTHYAFDAETTAGTVRVVVIDNSAGSLAASDPSQNPLEPQLPWLRDVLTNARSRGIPVVVMGNRDLNPAAGGTQAATDAAEVTEALVEGGASAYIFDRPDENRTYRIPPGAPAERSIPSFGSGTLGYGKLDPSVPDFGESGLLLMEIDAAARDPRTNRAPVTASLFPVIGELSVDAIDGTVLRRSSTALFDALGRRPRGGIRAPGGSLGPDPYVKAPADICDGTSCAQRIEPRVRFTSSRPDIGDFVRRDPRSASRRAVLLDANDRPISDPTSSLFCAFNAGTTTITVSMGNLTFSQEVRVLSGSVQRPCGTRPLTDPPVGPVAERPVDVAPSPDPAPDPAPPPAFSPPVLPAAPAPLPAAAAAATPSPPPAAAPALPALPALPSLPVPVVTAAGFIPVIPPPPVQPLPRPTPPSGTASVRVFEEEREEEEAFEQSSAFVRYDTGGGTVWPGLTLALVVVAAASGASIVRRRRRKTPVLGVIRNRWR